MYWHLWHLHRTCERCFLIRWVAVVVWWAWQPRCLWTFYNYVVRVYLSGRRTERQCHQGNDPAIGTQRGPGIFQVSKMLQHKTGTCSSLLSVSTMHSKNGSSLSMVRCRLGTCRYYFFRMRYRIGSINSILQITVALILSSISIWKF